MRTALVAFSLGIAASAVPCGCVARKGAPVRFAGQTNIVLWDAVHGVEHFVRDARFTTAGASLAFIAPTPGRPTLSGASPHAFEALQALEPIPEEFATAGAVSAIDEAATKGVQVVGVQDVAGYRATVLKASDASALTNWLGANGYPSPAFLTRWAAPYVGRDWYFTAFKVNGEATGPMRMSFETDRPFNPYSVPAENGRSGVPLRLYYVSAGSEAPKIGGRDAWRSPEWSAPIPEETRATLATDLRLSAGDIPKEARVTSYQDATFGKPGFDDLYFVPDPTLRNSVGGGAVAVVLLALALRRRRNAAAAQAS